MINNIYKIVISVLILALVLGYIFYERQESSHEKEIKEMTELLNKINKEQIDSLKLEISELEESLNVSEKERQINVSNYQNLKFKLKDYEKIRYYDDIDFDSADSIISNSHYRHNK